MPTPISILSTGLTAFGEHWKLSLKDLIVQAVDEALDNANLTIDAINKIYIGNMLGAQSDGQSQLGAIIASHYGTNAPAIRVEAACASGGVAVAEAFQYLQANTDQNVLVIGAEKMTNQSADVMARYLSQAASNEERIAGATFPSLYALLAQTHMHTFGTTNEQLTLPAVLGHKAAMDNPLAQFRREITVEKVIASTPIATPLNILHCSPITDGAAAVILTNKEHSHAKAALLASSMATDSLGLAERESLTEIKATRLAAEKLFDQTDITREHIHAIELHDCFSIAYLLAIEDMGFVKKGKAGETVKQIAAGESNLPKINLSGGLKAFGHPVGATGVKQIVSIVRAMQENDNLHYGLTHNIGGSGATCVMHLIEKK